MKQFREGLSCSIRSRQTLTTRTGEIARDLIRSLVSVMLSGMILSFILTLQAPAAPPPTAPPPPQPKREISDPGVIATNQRVTPAGVQSVFTDRVFGVRFGARPGEIWVTT